MKKSLAFLILFVFVVCAFAEKQADVVLRYGKQDGSIRIVIESGDEFIKKSIVATSAQSISVEFPDAFELKKPLDFTFETSKKERSLVISLKDIGDIASYKLSSPSRIVFDLKPLQKPQKDQQAKQDIKTDQEAKTKKEPVQPSAQKTAGPAQTTEKTLRTKSVVLDPGHGGYDHGITNKDIKEKEISLAIAKDLSASLAKKGIAVNLTRKADLAVPLIERSSLASSKKSDLLISIHATTSKNFSIYTASQEDAAAEGSVRTYSITSRQTRHMDKSRSLSKALASSLGQEFKAAVISRELPLPVLGSSDMPAVMMEYPLSEGLTYDQKMRERVVKAVIKGLENYEQ